MLEMAGKTEFFEKTPLSGQFQSFAFSWVRAAGVRPKPGPCFLQWTSSVYEHLPLIIEDKNRKCTMKPCRDPMTALLFLVARDIVIGVDAYQHNGNQPKSFVLFVIWLNVFTAFSALTVSILNAQF